MNPRIKYSSRPHGPLTSLQTNTSAPSKLSEQQDQHPSFFVSPSVCAAFIQYGTSPSWNQPRTTPSRAVLNHPHLRWKLKEKRSMKWAVFWTPGLTGDGRSHYYTLSSGRVMKELLTKARGSPRHTCNTRKTSSMNSIASIQTNLGPLRPISIQCPFTCIAFCFSRPPYCTSILPNP